MQFTLVDLLRLDHILADGKATSAQDAIKWLTHPLIQSGHVASGFAEDVWKREQIFPTGLPTQPLAVAIPHADPDHVNQSAVCIGVLQSPVQFGQMGTDGSLILDARIIFLLAIKEKEKQVGMIQQLITLIQAPTLLEGLITAKTAQAIMDLVRGTLE
jgi:PTS system galactitol-specific IIA component